MNISEIFSGELLDPNIPVFNHSKHECDMDGFMIMSDLWNGYYVLGILDRDNTPKSYVIVEPEKNGLCKLREIYTLPKYRGQNLAATLLLSLKGKLGIRLLIDTDEVVSKDARVLILKMVRAGLLTPSLVDGTSVSYDRLDDIFSQFKSDYAIIIEGCSFMDWERRFRKDEILSERVRLKKIGNYTPPEYD